MPGLKAQEAVLVPFDSLYWLGSFAHVRQKWTLTSLSTKRIFWKECGAAQLIEGTEGPDPQVKWEQG